MPPSFHTKISEIEILAEKHGQTGITAIFKEIIRTDIRNAFFHSDYILYDGELRLKHKGSQFAKIPNDAVFELVQNTVDFFQEFLQALNKAKRSFPKGHVIKGRKSPLGMDLCSIELLFDDSGNINGFQGSDPLPLW